LVARAFLWQKPLAGRSPLSFKWKPGSFPLGEPARVAADMPIALVEQFSGGIHQRESGGYNPPADVGLEHPVVEARHGDRLENEPER
jgi:hypothetical protein